MKYYDAVPENFLLIRLVATRFCNYRCPYCYLSLEKRCDEKTMFSHHRKEEWIRALKDSFADKSLEFYFTGGEPLLVDDCVLLVKELVSWDNVKAIRIDSNFSNVEKFLEKVNSKKVRFLSAFHPTQISLDDYLDKIEPLIDREMIDMVNFVASKENLKLVQMPPHELVKIFDKNGVFLNVAKDFERGLFQGYGYDVNYKKYVDMLQFALDNDYMNQSAIAKGVLCGTGKHYISINRHGQIFSCGRNPRKGLGNIFNSSVNLSDVLSVCNEKCCPSIISYSFSCSNEFLPVKHMTDYVMRCQKTRQDISEVFLHDLWKKIDIDKIFKKKRKFKFW